MVVYVIYASLRNQCVIIINEELIWTYLMVLHTGKKSLDWLLITTVEHLIVDRKIMLDLEKSEHTYTQTSLGLWFCPFDNYYVSLLSPYKWVVGYSPLYLNPWNMCQVVVQWLTIHHSRNIEVVPKYRDTSSTNLTLTILPQSVELKLLDNLCPLTSHRGSMCPVMLSEWCIGNYTLNPV